MTEVGVELLAGTSQVHQFFNTYDILEILSIPIQFSYKFIQEPSLVHSLEGKPSAIKICYSTLK